MKLKRALEGIIYAYKHDGRVVLCYRKSARCIGSPSGCVVYLINASGYEHAETRDDILKPATMRQHRDYWRAAFEDLVNGMD